MSKDNKDLIQIKTQESLPAFSLSCGDLGLTTEEQHELNLYQESQSILGPAAGSILLCPGNQVNTKPNERCPYFFKCPLRRMGKAPQNKLCPLEHKMVEDRFSSWCQELEADPIKLSESDRSAIADLVWIDLQVQRCTSILSQGEDARMLHTNVTEAILMDADSPPVPITTEIVLHNLTIRLDQLLTQRRMILKDWMLTPEQKFKIAKEMGTLKKQEDDLSTKLSANAEKLDQIIGG